MSDLTARRARSSLWDAILLGAMLVLVVLAAVGPWLVPSNPTTTDFGARLQSPSAAYPLGTDALGRDQLSRLLAGARATLGLALIISLGAALLGLAAGLAAAAMGGTGDRLLTRATEVLQAFPELIAALAIAALFGPSVGNLVLALVVTGWMRYARLTRSMALAIVARDHVALARMAGLSRLAVLRRHVLPLILPALLVMWTGGWARSILAVSALGFLGFGIQPPAAEWGAMLLDARRHMVEAPHLMWAPGLAILFAVLAISLAGDRLRDLFPFDEARVA
ncbi:MAG: ABC transporter permease [Loktanella sp.]|nr:ABC transporter permease [Loktanella sp.]